LFRGGKNTCHLNRKINKFIIVRSVGDCTEMMGAIFAALLSSILLTRLF
jgi:hypothetical protein